MKKIIVILFFASLVLQGFAQSREVPFTLDDRDRIMRTEEKLDALQGEVSIKIESLRNEMNAKFDAIEFGMDAKFDAVDQRFEAMEIKLDAMNSQFAPLYWAMGIFIAISLFTLGYIIWDRRTALYPVQDKTRDHEERLRKIEYVTKEQAKKDPAFAELLKLAGLL